MGFFYALDATALLFLGAVVIAWEPAPVWASFHSRQWNGPPI